MITDQEKKTLQDIVGEKWVATDPCILDSYSFYMNPEALNREGGRFSPRPVAVVQPENTGEVQEIVRFCNTNDLMVKPFSTGFCVMGAPSRDRVITVDLKRMNRIVDIDVKNQIAVVEPYVRAIDLQTRLFEHGLNCHVISAGGHHSLLASATSAWGTGINGPLMGYSSRNLLGVEWVLPTGEVATLGSAGDGAGWFSPDGPGPATRGIMRGFQGAFGGLGVFTKCALKLYRWDGPKTLEVEGSSPDYSLKEFPPRISLNVMAFPSKDAMREAGYKLGEAEVEYAQFRTPMFFSALGSTQNNEELIKVLETGVFQKMANYTLVNAVVGYSDDEFEWKMKALKEIVQETGGALLPTGGMADPEMLQRIGKLTKFIKSPLALLGRFPILQKIISAVDSSKLLVNKDKMTAASQLFWLMLRHASNCRGTLRASQALATTLGTLDTWDVGINQADWIAEAKQGPISEGTIVDDGGDLGCGGIFEGGHMGYLEGIVLYNTRDPKSLAAASDLVEGGIDASIDQSFGIPIAGFGQEANSRLGPACGNYHVWLSKIKNALDPNLASDPHFYAEPEKTEDK
ncbi:MAG: FAD-binding oxidoreductase [Proteobacteria bacterium]|nr:FAD-binding oxidoreductase [Pseudomonadota bacterium]